jgi:hypothetical protein
VPRKPFLPIAVDKRKHRPILTGHEKRLRYPSTALRRARNAQVMSNATTHRITVELNTKRSERFGRWDRREIKCDMTDSLWIDGAHLAQRKAQRMSLCMPDLI